MLPQDTLSTIPHPSEFLAPRDRAREPLVDYELGGVALNNATQGLEVQVWRLRYTGGAFVLDAPSVAPTTIIFVADVKTCALAFDQNMQPVIAWETEAGECRFRWFDPTIPAFTIEDLPAGSRSPRCTLDDKRPLATITGRSDVILAYMRNGSLYYRQQRDRFDTERELATDVEDYDLDQIGMNALLRLQFRLKPRIR